MEMICVLLAAACGVIGWYIVDWMNEMLDTFGTFKATLQKNMEVLIKEVNELKTKK